MSAWLKFGTYYANPPYVAHNDTSDVICFVGVCIPPNYLHLHPGPNNEVTVVRWTAPSSGVFCVQGAVAGLDNKPTTAGSFVIGRYKVKPFVSGIYKPSQNLALFLQVYDAEMDQATLKPALKVEYVVTKGGEEVFHAVEDGKGQGMLDIKGQQMVIVHSIPLKDALAAPGSYVITVKVTDLVSQKVVAPHTTFTIVNR